MNVLALLTFTVVSLVVFGWPTWNLAQLRGRRSYLWLVIPMLVPIIGFGLTLLLEQQELTSLYIPVKAAAYYLLIFGLVLFGISLPVMAAKYLGKLSKDVAFWLIIGGAIVFTLAARINGERLVVKTITLPAENITRPYQFVHISDLHSGSTDVRHARRVVDRIQELDHEFTVITGDFIDEYHVTPADIEPFNDLQNPIYLITGNHEYYLPENTINNVIAGSDIQLIDDMRVEFAELDIIGVNELHTVDHTLDTVGGINPERYSILLDHQPKTDEALVAESSGVHLMLSGHTHKGQVWPTSLLVRLQFRYLAGLYEIGRMFLYVNQGTGHVGPPLRLGSVNEITLIRLEPTLVNER